jgi:hypothetical protein
LDISSIEVFINDGEEVFIGRTVLLRLQQTVRCFLIWQNGTYNSGVHPVCYCFFIFYFNNFNNIDKIIRESLRKSGGRR